MLNDKTYKYKVDNSDRDELIDAIYEHFKDKPNNIVTKEIIESLIVDYEGLITSKLSGLSIIEHVLMIPGIGYIYNESQRKSVVLQKKKISYSKKHNQRTVYTKKTYLQIQAKTKLQEYAYNSFMSQELNYFFLVG